MEISQTTIAIIFIFLPGLIGTVFLRYLTTDAIPSPFYTVIYSFLIGICSYFILEIIYFCFLNCFNVKFGTNLKLWAFIKGDNNFEIQEVIFSTLLSISIVLVLANLITNKIIIRNLQKFGLTNRFGDEDLWNYYLSSSEINWIYIRDYANSLTYRGRLKYFSSANSMRELGLEEVTVYSLLKSKELYTLESVYLSLLEGTFSIEVPRRN